MEFKLAEKIVGLTMVHAINKHTAFGVLLTVWDHSQGWTCELCHFRMPAQAPQDRASRSNQQLQKV